MKKTQETMPLADCAPMELYLTNRKLRSELQAQAAQIQARISGLREEIATAQARIPDLSPLLARREDLLADLALGVEATAELAALDSEIDDKRAAHAQITAAAKETVEASEQTIAGLQRRLVAIEQELSARSDKKHEERLVVAVLKHHAETLGEEYLQAATQLKGLFMRLMALHSLTRQHGASGGIAAHCYGDFAIPSFNLDACRPHEMRAWPGNLFLANILLSSTLEGAMVAEREMLQLAGLDCV